MVVYSLISEIIAGNVMFSEVQKVEIKTALEELTDTAVFSVPRNYKLEGKLIADHLKIGDKVIIKLGYNDSLEIEFEGYISKIKAGVPLTIECEDEMFNLKKSIENKSWKKATIKDVVSYIAPDYKVNYLDENFDLGKFKVQNTTATKVLESLKDFGFYSYFKNKELNIAFLSGFAKHAERFTYDKYRIKDAKSLSFISKEEQKYKIKAISNNKNGKKLNVEIGDVDGDLRTFNYLEKTENELKELANTELENLKKDRAKGSIKGFGMPRTRAGDYLEILENKASDVKGKFLIEKTQISFGNNGFERINELGVQI